MPEQACPRYVVGRPAAPAGARRRALFLDRDGVINLDHGYTHRRESFEFMPGIFELARRATQGGHVLVVVTNQAGIGRGYYDEATFASLTEWMVDRFADEGAEIERVYFCPHHPEALPGPYQVACACRKPSPGMIQAACADLALDPAASLIIGDKAGDVQAGARAGIGTLVLVGPDHVPQPGPAVLRVRTVQEAAESLFPRHP